MAVPYKLLKTKGNLPKNAEMRAVLDEYSTAGIKQIAPHIVRATALTTAELVGTLEALKTELVDQLMMGNRVHLPGLGYFSLAVKGELYEDPHTHRYRLQNARVRTVNFRPEKELMKTLQEAVQFENVTYRSEPHAMPTPEEVDAALDRLFAASQVILVGDLRSELRLSSTLAYRLAAKLEAEGRIENIGSKYRKMLVKRG